MCSTIMRAGLMALAGLLVSSHPLTATTVDWVAYLSGSNSVPPVISSGSGFGFGTYDDVTNQLDWNVSWSGLSGPAVAAHFHEAPPGANGPVKVPFLDLSNPNIGMAILDEALEASFLSGNFYINVHTPLHPGGEIRGQVSVVPEPGTVGLLLGGLAMLGLRRKLASSKSKL
jgi:hypothetical protein